MISRPSPVELVGVVRAELKEVLAPELTSPQAHAALAMADAVLGHVQAVVDGELAWIREEVEDIAITARAIIEAGGDADGRIAAAAADVEAHRSDGWDVGAARADYGRASEVLSRCLEAGVRLGGDVRTLAETALEQRVAREVQIKGALAHAARVEEGDAA